MIKVGRLCPGPVSFRERDESSRGRHNNEIRSFILQKNYPCVAAIQSVVRNDYVIGTYGQFGYWYSLA